MAWITGRGGGFAQFSGPPDFGSGAMSARFSARHSQTAHSTAARTASSTVQRAANFAQSRQTLSASATASNPTTFPDSKVPSLRTSLEVQPSPLPSATLDTCATGEDLLSAPQQNLGGQELDMEALAILSNQYQQQLMYQLTLQQFLSSQAQDQAIAAAAAAAALTAATAAHPVDCGADLELQLQALQLEHSLQQSSALSPYEHTHTQHQAHTPQQQLASSRQHTPAAPLATQTSVPSAPDSPKANAQQHKTAEHHRPASHQRDHADDTSSSVSTSAYSSSHNGSRSLPAEIARLVDPAAPVSLPPAKRNGRPLDNRELDKLVATLGRNKATWRRCLLLYDWLKESGHHLDDRLCTTLIRVCAEHGQAATALGVYEWMRAHRGAGGAGLVPTVYTYTAAMRAALSANMLEKAMQVWQDAQRAGCKPDCRLCITYIEVCSRIGNVDGALVMYEEMRSAPANSRLAPTVHAYTAAMRAATEGGRWQQALGIWEDMRAAGCQATGHAFAAAISACAAGNDWSRAVAMFDDMCSAGITPDVVSCTALVTALASAAQWVRAEQVVSWMLKNHLRPNVRTYTALLTAMGNAKQWERAVDMLRLMQTPAWGSVQPNAYSYSALLKSLGEHGQWQLAEAVFSQLEREVLGQAASTDGAVTPAPAVQSPGVSTNNGPAFSQEQGSRNWTSPAQLNGLNLDFRPAEQGSAWQADPLTHTADSVVAQFSHLAVHDPIHDFAPHAVDNHEHEHAAGEQAGNGTGFNRQQNRWERSIVNEVVCGALMLAYERVGKWEESVAVLGRARKMGIRPNTVMYNTAISAAGKAGQLDVAERLFRELTSPDMVTFETMIAAYGMAGLPHKAEAAFMSMVHLGWQPRDYAYCGLIAAYSLAGDFQAVLSVQNRIRCSGQAVTVHVYNALLAACERSGQWEAAAQLHQCMCREGVEVNNVTLQLLTALSKRSLGLLPLHAPMAGLMTQTSNALAAAGNALSSMLAAPQLGFA